MSPSGMNEKRLGCAGAIEGIRPRFITRMARRREKISVDRAYPTGPYYPGG
jgi:hypothetical protein